MTIGRDHSFREMFIDECACSGQSGGFIQRARQLFQPLQHLGRRGINIEVRSGRQLQLMLEPLQPGIDQKRIGDVWIGCRIGGAQLGPAVFSHGRRNADQLGAVFR